MGVTGGGPAGSPMRSPGGTGDTPVNGAMQRLHERVPVSLETPDLAVWLGKPEGDPAAPTRPVSNDERGPP